MMTLTNSQFHLKSFFQSEFIFNFIKENNLSFSVIVNILSDRTNIIILKWGKIFLKLSIINGLLRQFPENADNSLENSIFM